MSLEIRTPLPADRNDERGFTLLEVLVAVAIFALGSVTVLGIRTNAYREARAAQDFNVARYLLQQQMEAVLLEPREYKDGDEGGFEDEPDEIQRRYYWALEMEEIFLIGGEDEDEDDGLRDRASRRAGEDPPSADSGSGLSGEDEEQQEVIVYRVTVFVHYPGTGGAIKQLSATTYIPGDAVEDEELF